MFGCKGLFPAKAGGHGHRSALGSAAGRGVGPHGKEQGLISGKSRLVKYYNLARFSDYTWCFGLWTPLKYPIVLLCGSPIGAIRTE